MTLPTLPNWKASAHLLHQIVSLVGPVHKALLAPRNNFLHLPMSVRPEGLVSQTLPGGGKIHLDLRAGELSIHKPVGEGPVFAFSDYTQRSLVEALLSALAAEGLGPALGLDRGGSAVEGLVSKLVSEGAAGESVSVESLTSEEPLTAVLDSARAYARVQYSVFTALSRARARLEGAMTPLIVWPEHLDLSTLWFPPSNHSMDDHGPHISLGFAPFTPGQYEYPYFYAYAYPYPEPFDPPALPASAFWHDEGWRGVVVTYQEITSHRDPEAFLEGVALEVFQLLAEVLEE